MRRSLSRPAMAVQGRWEVPTQSCLGEHWQEAGLNQIGFVRNPFYWIAAFSFIFTYLAGTAVYSVVVSSINAEVTRSVDQSLFVLLSFSRIMH